MTARDPKAQEQIGRELRPALEALRAQRVRAAARSALARSLARAPHVALAILVAVALAALATRIPPWLALAGAVVVLLAPALAAAFRAARTELREVDAALACDEAHATRDRLSAALDLAAGDAGGAPLGELLARAAIADGVDILTRVDPRRIAAAAPPPGLPWRRTLVALVALGLGTWLVGLRGERRAAEPGVAGTSAAAPGRATSQPAAANPVAAAASRATAPVPPPTSRGSAENARAAGERRPGEPPAVAGEPQPAVPAAPGAGASGSEAAPSQSPAGLPKAAPAGAPGSGRPGGGSGQAAASAAQPTPEARKENVAAARPRKPQAQRPSPDQEPKPSESAGAPSGPSRGSGRMAPVGNRRQDLSRGQEREEEVDVADEPVEDESDEQEQRGGVMPMRRQDQRPAARELSISGDGPPDQGRGGPTPPKKSRGTASLVLGLRLPDQVRGQPNPGTAKTSIEQIPPRRQDQDPGLAHAATGTRTGTVQRSRGVATELDRLLAAYHARLRVEETTPPASRPAEAAR